MESFNIQDVIDFFNSRAATWDDGMVRNEPVINYIMDIGGIRPGIDVLDVACGTGVLFPDYLARGVKSLTAIDIAPEMARRAQEKFPAANVICGNVETWPFYRTFDSVMVYNAFPHFPDYERIVKELASLTSPGGRFTVAHGMSLEKLRAHHSGAASRISHDMLSAEELAALMRRWCVIDTAISDNEKFIVSGVRIEADLPGQVPMTVFSQSMTAK